MLQPSARNRVAATGRQKREPMGPSTAILFGWCPSSSTNKVVPISAAAEALPSSIEAVENSTVTGKKLPAVLDTALALKLRPKDRRPPTTREPRVRATQAIAWAQESERNPCPRRRVRVRGVDRDRDQPAYTPSPFARVIDGASCAFKTPAGKISGGIGNPDDGHQSQQQGRRARLQLHDATQVAVSASQPTSVNTILIDAPSEI